MLGRGMMMGGYSKAPMLTTGAGAGTVTSNTAGYALSGFADTAFAYLNAPKTSGKWYWEATSAADYILFGVADDVATAVSYGGYSTTNAGFYSSAANGWVDSGWTAGNVGTSASSSYTPGDVMGFALDMDSATKTLKIYKNNTLDRTISWTGGAPTLRPHFGFQSSPSAQVKLGSAGCTYSPPGGYFHI